MPINILMPALSPTMEKGNLARWLKKEGDTVKSGDVLAEIETDKATMEVEAIDEGVLAKIVVPDGTQDVAVNALIGIIASEGEDVKAVGAGGGARRCCSRSQGRSACRHVGRDHQEVLRGRVLRGNSARFDAQDDCAPTCGGQDHDSAFLPDGGLRTRHVAGRPRGD